MRAALHAQGMLSVNDSHHTKHTGLSLLGGCLTSTR